MTDADGDVGDDIDDDGNDGNDNNDNNDNADGELWCNSDCGGRFRSARPNWDTTPSDDTAHDRPHPSRGRSHHDQSPQTAPRFCAACARFEVDEQGRASATVCSVAEDETQTVSCVAEAGVRATAHLIVTSGPDADASHELDQPVIVLGRDTSADITVHGEGVSRHHAKVVIDEAGTVQLVDLAAKNGTFVNGTKVSAAFLEHGDRIQLGRIRLRFDRGSTKVVAHAASGELQVTARELEIGRLVARGLTNAEVGEVLGISRATVSTHLQRAYKRLGVGSRAELVAYITAHEPE